MSLALSFVPARGYEWAAETAKRAAAEGRTLREICEEEKALPHCGAGPAPLALGGRE